MFTSNISQVIGHLDRFEKAWPKTIRAAAGAENPIELLPVLKKATAAAWTEIASKEKNPLIAAVMQENIGLILETTQGLAGRLVEFIASANNFATEGSAARYAFGEDVGSVEAARKWAERKWRRAVTMTRVGRNQPWEELVSSAKPRGRPSKSGISFEQVNYEAVRQILFTWVTEVKRLSDPELAGERTDEQIVTTMEEILGLRPPRFNAGIRTPRMDELAEYYGAQIQNLVQATREYANLVQGIEHQKWAPSEDRLAREQAIFTGTSGVGSSPPGPTPVPSRETRNLLMGVGSGARGVSEDFIGPIRTAGLTGDQLAAAATITAHVQQGVADTLAAAEAKLAKRYDTPEMFQAEAVRGWLRVVLRHWRRALTGVLIERLHRALWQSWTATAAAPS